MGEKPPRVSAALSGFPVAIFGKPRQLLVQVWAPPEEGGWRAVCTRSARTSERSPQRMRALLLLVTVLAATGARAAAPATPTSPQATAPAAAAPAPTNQDCLGCHESAKRGESDGAGRQGIVTALFGASVHKDLACTTCHAGYSAPGPHEVPAPADAAEAALL